MWVKRWRRMSQTKPELTVPLGQRVFIHVNNTNPVLQPAAAERAMIRAAGWHVAHDGMELAL